MSDEKIIVTITGQDKTGIVAKIATTMAEVGVNIEDIKQTIMQNNFAMIMLCDIKDLSISFKEFKDEILELSHSLDMEIWIQKKELFDKMHTI